MYYRSGGKFFRLVQTMRYWLQHLNAIITARDNILLTVRSLRGNTLASYFNDTWAKKQEQQKRKRQPKQQQQQYQIESRGSHKNSSSSSSNGRPAPLEPGR
jgi:hypothetical protein